MLAVHVGNANMLLPAKLLGVCMVGQAQRRHIRASHARCYATEAAAASTDAAAADAPADSKAADGKRRGDLTEINISEKFLPKSRVQVTVTVPAAACKAYMKASLRAIQKTLSIAGFRKGEKVRLDADPLWRFVKDGWSALCCLWFWLRHMGERGAMQVPDHILYSEIEGGLRGVKKRACEHLLNATLPQVCHLPLTTQPLPGGSSPWARERTCCMPGLLTA